MRSVGEPPAYRYYSLPLAAPQWAKEKRWGKFSGDDRATAWRLPLGGCPRTGQYLHTSPTR